MKKTTALLAFFFCHAVGISAQQVTVQDDAKVGVIVTGTGNVINTTQIFGKSPEYAELKKRLDGLQAAIAKKADECGQMAKDSLPAKYRDGCRAELIALNAERDSVQKIETRFREDVIRLAETFSKIELNSERLRLAKQFFEGGKIREADAVLERAEMEKETEALLSREKRQKQEVAATDSLLRVKANEWLIKAQATQTRYDLSAWFDSTAHYYRQSLRCRETAGNTFQFARFLQVHNQHDSAIVYYRIAAGKYLAEKDTANWLGTQNNLGMLYNAKNDFALAKTAYLEVLEIRKRLAKDNPQTYEPGVAHTQNNLGVLYLAKNDLVRAETAFLEAMEIYKRLAKANPQTYEQRVADTQNNLGNLYYAKNDFASAETAYLEALEIRKRLAKINPQTYEPYVVEIQNNLGNLYSAKNDFARAETAYLEALEIFQRLAKANPRTYEPRVASTQDNLGAFYCTKNDFAHAETAFLEALEIRKRLAMANPQTYEPRVADTQNNLGVLYFAKNDYAPAETSFLEALEIRKRLAKANPQIYEQRVADTQNNLGVLYKNKSDFVRAETAFLEALEIFRRLDKSNPTMFDPYMTNILGDLSWLYLFIQEYPESQAAAEKALALDPTQNWVRSYLGHSYLLRGDWENAKKVYEEYLKNEPDPAEGKTVLLKDWDDLEKASVTHKDMEKARKWVRE